MNQQHIGCDFKATEQNKNRLNKEVQYDYWNLLRVPYWMR